MNDPLKGLRKGINDREIKTLIWPASAPCPVEKGERYELQSCVIEIDKVSRKLIKGREAEWQATFVRHEQERVNLLRAAPPKRAPDESDAHLGLSETEKARREGQYTTSRFAAMSDEPESVGPDWEDKKRGERELERQKERQKRFDQTRQDQDVDRAAARLKQVGKTLGANGVDLTHMLDDIVERLALEEKEAA